MKLSTKTNRETPAGEVANDQSCASRVDAQLAGVITDLSTLWQNYQHGTTCPDLGCFTEYGLSFDFVAAGTFDDQEEAYFRYQLSWGGPSDEFRFFVNPDLSCHRIEYWFLDWFDGASRTLAAEDKMLLLELWQWLVETGSAEAALKSDLES